MARISILTAAFNAESLLPLLIASLEAQTDTDFEWVLVDGGSRDHTVSLAQAASLQRKVIISEPDFGIYDALNKGVRAASGDYYLVMGADDTLLPDAVANYRRAAEGGPDMVTADVLAGGMRSSAHPGKAWLHGLRGYVSQHSVGALIRKDLHVRFGYYSRRFPIAADQYFIKSAANGGAVIRRADFIAGEFGLSGSSSVDVAGTLTEFFRVQLLTERSRGVQVILFIVRLLKHYSRL